jgi:hypothetical protein
VRCGMSEVGARYGVNDPDQRSKSIKKDGRDMMVI